MEHAGQPGGDGEQPDGGGDTEMLAFGFACSREMLSRMTDQGLSGLARDHRTNFAAITRPATGLNGDAAD